MTRRLAMLLVLAMIGLCTGCASFRSEIAVPANWPPPPASSKKSIRLVLTHDALVNGNKKDSGSISAWDIRALDAYRESGLFSSVSGSEGGETDLVANIHVVYGSQATPTDTILWGLTLMLYPMRVQEEIATRTVIKDRTGNTVATIDKRERVSTSFELFMVFAMPFNAPGSTTGKVLYDLHRATIADAQMRKAL